MKVCCGNSTKAFNSQPILQTAAGLSTVKQTNTFLCLFDFHVWKQMKKCKQIA